MISAPRLGILLALIGGLTISIDIPVIRLADTGMWSFLTARGFGMSLILGIILLFLPNWTQTPRHPFNDRDFVAVGILFGLSTIFFTIAAFTTSASHLVFILAFNPLIAALLAWAMIGERPTLATWIAIFVTIIGVGIIVMEGFETGTGWGDLSAFMAALMLGLSIVRVRKSGKDMSLAGVLGGMISGLFALPLAIVYWQPSLHPEWLLFNIFLLAPLGAFCLSLAPKFIPAPQVAMFYLLETVLAPVWIWLIFAEAPSTQSQIGGAIVLMAIGFHSYVQVREHNKTQLAS